jgi:adenine-specific DNA-methyltransferase
MFLEPRPCERPTIYADRIGRAYSNSTSAAHKKRFGQYLTPTDIADFMASLVACDDDEVRILDPGAGSGVLACAVAETLARKSYRPRQIYIDAYEVDAELISMLEGSLQYLRAQLDHQGTAIEYRILANDFVLDNGAQIRRNESLFDHANDNIEYDIVIGNPPYFKLPKSDPRARAAADVVHGQPNIYALFLAVSAALLRPGGEIVFISPRSFTSGPYFQRFRDRFFTNIHLESIHVFDSRRNAFNRDRVLQENLILKGCHRRHWARVGSSSLVHVSVSHGTEDIADREVRTMPICDLIDMDTKEKVLRIPSSESDQLLVTRIDSWTGSLRSFGMQVSTGPVVPFRARHVLSTDGNVPERHAPLLWLQNVHPMRVAWPTSVRKKEQFISTSLRDAMPLLVRDQNYVLVRRVSAKEERRRLTAAPLLKGQFGSDWVGIENHLNYVHRPGGSLTEEEAIGLAVIYNSEFMDTYFRVLNGSTQVSATEIRSIPLPPLDVIVEIGRRAKCTPLDSSSMEDLARISFADKLTC